MEEDQKKSIEYTTCTYFVEQVYGVSKIHYREYHLTSVLLRAISLEIILCFGQWL